MSYFGFKTDADGNVLVSDADIARFMEFVAKHMATQTAMMASAFDAEIDELDIEELDDDN